MNYPKNLDSALKWDYKFWSTQPVPKFKDINYVDGQIINIDPSTIRQTPYELVEGFEWCSLNVNEDDVVNNNNSVTISEFLDKYYIENSSNEFRLHYPADFIKWMYGHKLSLCIGVRHMQTKSLMGLICGKVSNMQINKNKMDMIEINLLCIHPKLRQKRLTPVLIKEITRQFNLKGYYQGVYTDANYLPKPIITANYYHRAINIETLLATGFTQLDSTNDLENVKRVLHLPDKNSKTFKKMESHHLDSVYELFNKYISKYNYHPIYTKEEFAYIFMDNKFVTSYVFENEYGDVKDFASYYTLPTKVLKNEKYKFINKAYLFYYTSNETTPYKIINELLIVAKNNNIDVFDALNIMENESILKELKFEEGTGMLHYYFYNWQSKPLKNVQVGVVFM